MAEYNILVEGRMIEFSGLMNVDAFIKMLDLWFRDRGYDKRETKNMEEVYEEGKQITIEMFPYKKISDNVMFEIRLFMVFDKLKETEVEKEGKKLRLWKGKAMISMDGYVITDYEHKWDKIPFYYFARVISDKYVFRNYINQARQEFMNDCTLLEDEIAGFLNLYRFRGGQVQGDRDAPTGKHLD